MATQDEKQEVGQLLREGVELVTKADKDASDKESMERIEKALESKLEEIRAADRSPMYKHGEEEDRVTSLQKAVDTPSKLFGSQSDSVKDFQKLNDALFLCKSAGMDITKFKSYQSIVKGDYPLMKLWYTSGAGHEGEDWVPVGFSSDFIDRMEGEYQVADKFVQYNMPKGIGTERVPGASTAANVVLLSQVTGMSDPMANTSFVTDITPNTRYITLDPFKLGGAIWITGEMEEDSAINNMNMARDELAISMARGLESAIINGDAANASNLDSGTAPGATDPRYAVDGLRTLAVAASTTTDWADTVDLTNWRKTLALMHSTHATAGHTTSNYATDAMCLVSISGLYKVASIPYLLTKDKVGDNATVVLGPDGIPTVFGVPVILSSQVREDLDANSGRDVAGGGTTTAVIFASQSGFMVATKRAMSIESGKVPGVDGIITWVTGRFDFKSRYAATTPVTAFGYGIDVTT